MAKVRTAKKQSNIVRGSGGSVSWSQMRKQIMQIAELFDPLDHLNVRLNVICTTPELAAKVVGGREVLPIIVTLRKLREHAYAVTEKMLTEMIGDKKGPITLDESNEFQTHISVILERFTTISGLFTTLVNRLSCLTGVAEKALLASPALLKKEQELLQKVFKQMDETVKERKQQINQTAAA